MATAIYLVKRKLRSKKRNGHAQTCYALRWKDPATGKWECETTATNDSVQADDLRKRKWAIVNGLVEDDTPEPVEAPPAVKTWQECRDALEAAMQADNLRPSTIADYLLNVDVLEATFTDAKGPAEITAENANTWKQERAALVSPWTLRGDLSAMRAIFNRLASPACGSLLTVNPFAGVTAPKCDEPEKRLLTGAESAAFFKWLKDRWTNWRLPLVYFDVYQLTGWRPIEVASIKSKDVADDGAVKCIAATSKTRKPKYAWLPADVLEALREQAADGWGFGRFSDDLRRHLLLVRKRPNHAARVKDFTPKRLMGWLQDEVARYNAEMTKAANEANANAKEQEEKSTAFWEPFTLYNFRDTTISGMRMAGIRADEASMQVGTSPEVMRRHYEKLDRATIARRNVETWRGSEYRPTVNGQQSLRAGCAQLENDSIDNSENRRETKTA